MGSRGRDLSTIGVLLTFKKCLTVTCSNLSVLFVNGLSAGWARKEVATSESCVTGDRLSKLNMVCTVL